MFKLNNQKIKHVEYIIEASPAQGMSLDDLVEKMKALGNPILSIDREANKIKMVHRKEVPVEGSK